MPVTAGGPIYTHFDGKSFLNTSPGVYQVLRKLLEDPVQVAHLLCPPLNSHPHHVLRWTQEMSKTETLCQRTSHTSNQRWEQVIAAK